MPILGWPGPLDEGKNSIGDPEETNAVPEGGAWGIKIRLWSEY